MRVISGYSCDSYYFPVAVYPCVCVVDNLLL